MPVDDSSRGRFEAVYSQTYEPILGYALRRCDSPEDAADVVAETFATAWRRVDVLPPGDEARLWLYGIARNILANHHRRQARRPVALAAELADVYAGRGRIVPEDSVAMSAIAEAFGAISDDDREILSLVAWEGLDHGEIATVLGASRNAVRIRLHRARKRFSKALSRVGVTVNRYAVESV